MQLTRLLALVVASVPGALCAASCAQQEDIEAHQAKPDELDRSPAPNFTAAERTVEAQDPWTRADCQNTFVRNIRLCDTWTVTARPACYAIMAGLHVACVKGGGGREQWPKKVASL